MLVSRSFQDYPFNLGTIKWSFTISLFDPSPKLLQKWGAAFQLWSKPEFSDTTEDGIIIYDN